MNELTPKGQIIQGFKMVNQDLTCRDFQFQIGVWHEHQGEIKLCESGFHFCEYPSGPWAYYGEGRRFKVEAEEVLLGTDPGADRKHAARRIRLVEEIFVGGDQNTGNRNTGDRNTGNRNTGDRNTGDRNTGHQNTGDQNTGHRNTGHRNTGHRNTGRQNTGDRNTGHRNTGDQNTGNGNIGDRNTGIGNIGDGHSGCFCDKPSIFYIFNLPAKKENVDFNLVNKLAKKLIEEKEEFDYSEFLSLPNASIEALKSIHASHIKARNERKIDASN